MSRKEPKTLRVACFEDGRRKIITFKRGSLRSSGMESLKSEEIVLFGDVPCPWRASD